MRKIITILTGVMTITVLRLLEKIKTTNIMI